MVTCRWLFLSALVAVISHCSHLRSAEGAPSPAGEEQVDEETNRTLVRDGLLSGLRIVMGCIEGLRGESTVTNEPPIYTPIDHAVLTGDSNAELGDTLGTLARVARRMRSLPEFGAARGSGQLQKKEGPPDALASAVERCRESEREFWRPFSAGKPFADLQFASPLGRPEIRSAYYLARNERQSDEEFQEQESRLHVFTKNLMALAATIQKVQGQLRQPSSESPPRRSP